MKKLIIGFFFLSYIFIYKNWFSVNPIIGGDWPYFFEETLSEFRPYPESWNSIYGNGLGGTIPNYFLNQYLHLTIYLFVNVLHISWIITYKILWFLVFLLLSSISIAYLFKTFVPSYKLWQLLLCIFLFTTNTYSLMIVGGGQMGIALAYAITPLVLALFIRLIDFIAVLSNSSIKNNIQTLSKKSVILGLVIATQIMFDPRMLYMSCIAVGLYFLLRIKIYRKFSTLFPFSLFGIGLPITLGILMHMQWILPLLVFRLNPIPEGVTNSQGFLFFSFADFSHALSLLHPNWPENIFGKVYFLRPEFLGLPILAYAALLFINSTNLSWQKNTVERKIFFFALLGLLGAFLAKGVNPPFEIINQWLFTYIPGMNLFRDPTKFYLLIAISYAMLIPFAVFQIIQNLDKIIFLRKKVKYIFILLTIFCLLLLISPALFGKLGGTFSRNEIPQEYTLLKDFLVKQPEFFRTLWVPKQSRFTFVSSKHPSVEAAPLFKATNSAEVVSLLQANASLELLARFGIKYIIVPNDSLGEIFLEDRKYNEKEKIYIEKTLDTVSRFKKAQFGKIIVYELPSYRDLFFLENEGIITFKIISPSQYIVYLSTKKEENLIFSQNYNSNWVAKLQDLVITSKPTKEGLNSFFLPAGTYKIEVSYLPDRYFYYGRIIAITTFFIAIISLIMLQSNNYYGRKK